MASKPIPTPEILRQLLRYQPDTGKLYWRERGPQWFDDDLRCRQWNTKFAGKEAFKKIMKDGHLQGVLFNVRYLAHRVIWVLHHGVQPPEIIDHANGDPADNRIANLRKATKSQNGMNSCARKHSQTGMKGVGYDARFKKYRARVRANGKVHWLGYFATAEEARAAYIEAATRLHGAFANMG